MLYCCRDASRGHTIVRSHACRGVNHCYKLAEVDVQWWAAALTGVQELAASCVDSCVGKPSGVPLIRL